VQAPEEPRKPTEEWDEAALSYSGAVKLTGPSVRGMVVTMSKTAPSTVVPRKRAFMPRLPDSDSSSQLVDTWGWADRISIIGLFAIAVGYTLFFLQEILIPIVLAWVMGAILRPVVEWAEGLGVPRIIAVVSAAFAALLILLGIIGLLSTPLVYWIGRTTELASLIKEKIQLLSQPLAFFDAIAHELSELSGGAAPATLNYDTSTIVRGILSTLTPIVTQFGLFFFAMIFWMLYANEIKSGIGHLFRGERARQVVRVILDDAENNVSRYFGTLAVVNLCLGVVAIGLAWAVGLPNPVLWGILAATLNFVPYLGPVMTVATFFVIGVMSFTTLGHALVAPLAWIGITTLEGQVITPTIVGHRLTLNPFLVFLSVAFWAWMWGPLGALLAVPLLISAFAVTRHLSSN
jgi:predicted PurR-regulated permease PerM